METYRNNRDYKLRESQKGKRSQRNKNDKRPEEPIKWVKSSGTITVVFFWMSQAWKNKGLVKFFLPIPFGDSSDFNCCLSETQVADGVSLKMWPMSPGLPSGLSVQMLLGEATHWPLAVRPGRGQPNPAVPVSTGKLLVFPREVSLLEVKGRHVSLYLYCELSTGHVFSTRNHFPVLKMTFPSTVDLPD